MLKRLRFLFLLAVLGLAWAVATPVGAQLADLGPSIAPHGYPAWYEDTLGLKLELCVPPPAGNATRPELCIFDALELDNEGNPLNPLVLTGESFWFLAETSFVMPGGGDAQITLGIEGTFGGSEEPINGQQISFGRTRIRIDTPVAGTYTVTHPYGEETFVVVDPEEGINMTADIGSANFLFPETAFRGTLTAPIGPFLTWPDYDTNPALQVLELDAETGLPTGVVLEQYIGDPNIASPVVNGPNGNIFRVQGPEFNGVPIDEQTNLFFVMGKVFDETVELVAHVFPDAPEPNLFAVGPVNREAFFLTPSIGEITGIDHDYPVGYPLWYQEALTEIDELTQEPVRVGGLQLTLCPPSDAMCVADPIDPASPDYENMLLLRTGGENFWFIAEAIIEITDDLDALVVLAVEATFGGTEAIEDGNQISFGRERIRVDIPQNGTYRITHPYGQRIFENLVVGDGREINMTSDIGIADLADPDGAFIGALYSDIGPTFLKWTTFDLDPALTDERLVKPNAADPELTNYYIGDPLIEHEVVGSPFDTNYFRIERLVSGDIENGTWALVAETDLFSVAGKIFDPATFEFAIDPNAPVAVNDAATLNMANATSVTINVLDNDTFDEGAPVTITILPAGEIFGPESGAAVANNPAGTVTYTPNAAFAAAGGVDTFGYNIVDSTGLTSNAAIVTVTVIPVETITVSKARLALNKLRWDLAGNSNLPGTTLTIYPGPAASGTPIGTALVANNGRWSLRATSTVNPNVNQITIINQATGTTLTQPLQVR